MRVTCCGLLSLLVLSFASLSPSAVAQTLLPSIPVGNTPVALAVNPATDTIFAVNAGSNNVTVISGATNSVVTSVSVGNAPCAVAVNPVTNKIYVANQGGEAAVTIIDGATYSVTPLVTGSGIGGDGPMPQAIAVNPVTNKIYVVNYNGNYVTVIDGSTIIGWVAVGSHPRAVAVNSITGKAYVANSLGGSVTVIDESNNYFPTTVRTNWGDPWAVAVNAETDTIYVANNSQFGSVSVIAGTNNSFTNVTVGQYPEAVAVNPSSNMIYVSNWGDGTVSVMNGSNLSGTPVTVPVGGSPNALAVMAATNKIYVANFAGSVAVLDGLSNSVIAGLQVGAQPVALAVEPASNIAYVANQGSWNVSVIAGASSDPLQFIPLTPCRVADTRNPKGPFGGPPISGSTWREFAIPNSACNVPTSAAAYSLNVTVVPQGTLGYLTVWPSGQDQPNVSTLNSIDGRTKANAAIVPAGAGGAISIFASNTTNVVLDINGYFAAVSGATFAFYPLPPCRLVDTRGPKGPLGGPYLQGGAPGRDFPLTSGSCGIPAGAQAYALNFTAVPHGSLGYLTTWPAGEKQPGVSTLNASTGVTAANAALVPAGTGGDIDVFVSNDSDVVIDINGYFGPASSSGLSLYPTAPCRVLDTRHTRGAFQGTIEVNVASSLCAVPEAAPAAVLSATVVPQGSLGYLTLWPDGWPKPNVSTLNAVDGAVTSNMAIVPLSSGWIDAFATNPTQLVLDISSYFGR